MGKDCQGYGLLHELLAPERVVESQNHRLEKTSKIIKSNHLLNSTMPTKPYSEVPHLHVF